MTSIQEILKKHLYQSTARGYQQCEKDLTAAMGDDLRQSMQLVKGAAISVAVEAVDDIGVHMLKRHCTSERDQELIASAVKHMRDSLILNLSNMEFGVGLKPPHPQAGGEGSSDGQPNT